MIQLFKSIIGTILGVFNYATNKGKKDTIGSCNNDNLCNPPFGSCTENTCECIGLVGGFYCDNS